MTHRPAPDSDASAAPTATGTTTGSRSTPAYPLASGGKRVLAYLIDLALLYVYIIVLFMSSMALDTVWPFHHLMAESYVLRHSISFFSLTFPLILYFILMEKGPRQGTLGKSWMKMRVVRVDGRRASLGLLTIRNVFKFLPWEIAHTHLHLNPDLMVSGVITPVGGVFGVGLPIGLMALFIGMVFLRRDLRAPYELFSGTHVVTTKTSATA